jgi:hypothetical protein
MRIPATSNLLLAIAIAVVGCDDPSLITVEAPDASPTPATDAGTDAGAFDLAACESCFMAPDMPGPGCGTEYAACQALSDCLADVMCLETSGCFGRPQSAFISCGLKCSTGNLSVGSPAYTAIVAFFECVTMSACDKACFAQ